MKEKILWGDQNLFRRSSGTSVNYKLGSRRDSLKLSIFKRLDQKMADTLCRLISIRELFRSLRRVGAIILNIDNLIS